ERRSPRRPRRPLSPCRSRRLSRARRRDCGRDTRRASPALAGGGPWRPRCRWPRRSRPRVGPASPPCGRWDYCSSLPSSIVRSRAQASRFCRSPRVAGVETVTPRSHRIREHSAMTDDTSRHELDDRLAGATMWAWYGPMFRLAFKHWPICLAAGLGALAIEWLIAALPWPFFPPWWVGALRGYVEIVASALVVVVAYRFLAERERVGTVNEWPTIVVRAVQIQTIWVVVGGVVLGVLALLALAVGLGARPNTVYAFAALG